MLVSMVRRGKSVAVLACLLLSGCAAAKPDPGGVRRQIAGWVAINSTPDQVVESLNRQKISHSRYRRDADKGNTIDAVVFVRSGRDIIDPSYSVVFTFDEHDRLSAYDVQWLGYIPL